MLTAASTGATAGRVPPSGRRRMRADAMRIRCRVAALRPWIAAWQSGTACSGGRHRLSRPHPLLPAWPCCSRYYVQSLLNLDEQALHSAWSKVRWRGGQRR